EAGAGVDLDVAVLRGGVARDRVVGHAGGLVVRDEVVLDHVQRMRRIATAVGRVLDHVRQARGLAPQVQAVEPARARSGHARQMCMGGRHIRNRREAHQKHQRRNDIRGPGRHHMGQRLGRRHLAARTLLDNRTVPPSLSGRCLVTGAAGFIGSHLAERLVALGCEVVGVDCFTDYYDPAVKERNVSSLCAGTGFTLVRADLAEADLAPLLQGIDYVFHQAGQPGVRRSWGQSFEAYVRWNVLATQRLLEAGRTTGGLRRFVNASSSSIYGNAAELPVTERALPRPVSPYGVTKLAAEHLATLYAQLGVPTVSLRYFTVYGPRQRPDMAFNIFIRCLLEGREISVNGDGEQTRDFTFVADAVDANLAAATAPTETVTGRCYNVGGGSRVT